MTFNSRESAAPLPATNLRKNLGPHSSFTQLFKIFSRPDLGVFKIEFSRVLRFGALCVELRVSQPQRAR
jgi:hypothetical protein